MIKIVTDSVASIPAEVAQARDIEVVSLFVNQDGREYREADMDVNAFYEGIAGMIDNPPTSSQPSQHVLETLFERAAEAADEVLGIFMSSKMSGTFEGAVRAARAVGERCGHLRCTLVDSTSNCGDEMFAVLDACDARDAGEGLTAPPQPMPWRRPASSSRPRACVLEGRRAHRRVGLLGGLLQISPVLTVAD
ncbi:MAG: DegV family protein [Adlercreutzia sp.]